jgi:hypothetical protein
MPGHRGAAARLLDEQRLVERREVRTVDRGGDGEKPGMAVDAQHRLGELQRAQDEIDDFLRCIGRGGGLVHLHRMAAVGEIGAAERIAERLGPQQARRRAVRRQRRPALGIERRAALDRQAVEDVVHVPFDVSQLVGLQHPFEDVEAAAPVGVEDVGMQLARVGEADRPAIAEARRAFLAFAQIRLHRSFFGAVVDARRPRSVHGASSNPFPGG